MIFCCLLATVFVLFSALLLHSLERYVYAIYVLFLLFVHIYIYMCVCFMDFSLYVFPV